MKAVYLLYRVFFFLLFAAILFQDIFLQEYIGTIARSLVVFIAPLIFIIILIIENKIILNTIPRYFFWYSLVTIATALIMFGVTILFVTNSNMYVYDEWMPVKLLKTAAYNIIFFLTAYCLFVLAARISIRFIYYSFLFWFIVLFFYGLIQYFFDVRLPYINSTFTGEFARIPLIASEPSTAAAFFTIVAALLIALRVYMQKSAAGTTVILIMALVTFMLVGSKASIVFLPIAVIWAIRKRFTPKMFVYALVIIIPLITFFVIVVVPQLATDLEGFNSVSTRSTTWLAAMQSLFLYPLGEGYGTYLVYYPDLLFPINDMIVDITGIPLLTFEISEMVNTGVNLSPKAGIPSEIVFNGFSVFIFLYYLIKAFNKQLRDIHMPVVRIILSFAGCFIFLEMLLSVAGETAYIYLMIFVIAEKIAAVDTINNPAKEKTIISS